MEDGNKFKIFALVWSALVVLPVNPVPTLHDLRDLLRATVLTKPGVSRDVITPTINKLMS